MMKPLTQPSQRTDQRTASVAIGHWVLITLLSVVGCCMPLAASLASQADQQIMTLREQVTLPDGDIRLRDLADLQGDYAIKMGEQVIVSLEQREKKGVDQPITMAQIRQVLNRADVHWGRLICRGPKIVQIVTSDVSEQRVTDETLPIQTPAAIDSKAEDAAPLVVAKGNQVAHFDSSDSSVRSLIEQWVRDQVRDQAAVVDVQVVYRRTNQAVLNERCRMEDLTIQIKKTDLIGSTVFVVGRGQGSHRQTVLVPAEVKVKVTQVVAARALQRGQTIVSADLKKTDVWVSESAWSALSDPTELVGQQVVHAKRINQAIDHHDVKPISVVRRGQIVTVIYEQGGIRLKNSGRAMGDGAIGASIIVRNERTRQRYTVEVLGPQRVRLQTAHPTTSIATKGGR